jgi:hypothetical protein
MELRKNPIHLNDKSSEIRGYLYLASHPIPKISYNLFALDDFLEVMQGFWGRISVTK